MSARDRLLDLFLNGGDGSQPEFEAALDALEQQTAAESAAYRSLDLGDLDGRVSASCSKPEHPTWLRKISDTRACPWCVMDLQSESLVARTHQLAHYQEIERNREAAQRADGSRAAVANLRIAELTSERDALQALLAERPVNETLVKAREAAADMFEAEVGERRPMWRVVITDSESPTGVAPVCTAKGDADEHMIDDYPGGPIRDEPGVFFCCPDPQFETGSPVLAAYLVELLNTDTGAGEQQ